jgi:hypothetical protein
MGRMIDAQAAAVRQRGDGASQDRFFAKRVPARTKEDIPHFNGSRPNTGPPQAAAGDFIGLSPFCAEMSEPSALSPDSNPI